MGGACNIAGSQSFYSYAAGSWSSKVPKNMQVLIFNYSQDKTRQDVGCIFRSGNAEWREAMQRIVDLNDAKPERKRRPQMLCFSLRRVLLMAGSFAAILPSSSQPRDARRQRFYRCHPRPSAVHGCPVGRSSRDPPRESGRRAPRSSGGEQS